MFTKGGCLVAPTVNPECTALHVRHLRIRIIVYSLSYVVKPVRFDIGCIKRNIYLFNDLCNFKVMNVKITYIFQTVQDRHMVTSTMEH